MPLQRRLRAACHQGLHEPDELGDRLRQPVGIRSWRAHRGSLRISRAAIVGTSSDRRYSKHVAPTCDTTASHRLLRQASRRPLGPTAEPGPSSAPLSTGRGRRHDFRRSCRVLPTLTERSSAPLKSRWTDDRLMRSAVATSGMVSRTARLFTSDESPRPSQSLGAFMFGA